jgi:signal transduction histidine kinase
MNFDHSDITRHVLSSSDLQNKVAGIFSDSIILNGDFQFLSISKNILCSLGYDFEELVGKSISVLTHSSDLKQLLSLKLRGGSCLDEQIEIRTKNQSKLWFSVSGFELGNPAGDGGLYVLKFTNLDEINLMYDRLEAKTMELDRFVYLSGHALRGPLATMKGLLNLARKSSSLEEIRSFVNQIDLFAERLDNKLYRLIYFAEADKENESGTSEKSLETIVKNLEDTVINESFGPLVQFRCDSPNRILPRAKEILSLLRNVALFFANQSKKVDNELRVDFHSATGVLEIVMKARGFLLTDSTKEHLYNTSFGYSEILSFPELINCYAAKKIAFKLKGRIQFILNDNEDAIVLITLPLS